MSIAVTNLRVRYGSFEAVKGIGFRVEPGQICGYLGPNGAGKSSTVKAMVGILRPHSGSVEVGGHDVVSDRIAAQRGLGYVPENAAVYPLLTGWEFLELIVELHELPRDEAEARRDLLVERFDLGAVAGRPTATYSKGQRQKLAIVSALLHDPDVLILDEPLSGLDANAARTVKELLQELASRGRTVLFCSHYLEIVERLCHRVVILDDGVVVADSAVSELVSLAEGRTLERVFAELTQAAASSDVAALAEALRHTGDRQ